jgi:hypothetical protein
VKTVSELADWKRFIKRLSFLIVLILFIGTISPINVLATDSNVYTTLSPTVYRTAKSSVPVWSEPKSTSTKVKTIASTNTSVVIIGKITNSYGNVWLKTHDGYWVFSGNLVLYKYQINTGDVRYNEKPVSTTKIFREQLVSGSTCTLATYANLMRRYEVIYKKTTSLLNKDENYFKPYAWGDSGLKGRITYGLFSPAVVVEYRWLNGTVAQKKSQLIDYLKSRPEGILVYSKNKSGTGKHAILLTDYDPITDTFYMYDPIASTTYTGRQKLSLASIFGITQSEKISHIFKLWVINK